MSQQNKKKKAPSKTTGELVLFELQGPLGKEQVQASGPTELKLKLMDRLQLEPYSAQAVAHLAYHEKAGLQNKIWSVKRLGVFAFVPDEEESMPRQGGAQKKGKAKVSEPVAELEGQVSEVDAAAPTLVVEESTREARPVPSPFLVPEKLL